MSNQIKAPRSLGANAGPGRSEIAKNQNVLNSLIIAETQLKSARKAKGWPPVSSEKHNQRYGQRHRKMRAELLAKEPHCRACAAIGKVAIASIADHQLPLSAWPYQACWGLDALQPLCIPCHAQKTAQEGGKARWAQHNALKRIAAFTTNGGRIL